MPDDPVQPIPTDNANAAPEAGLGLCLSGGGYRAMLFHHRGITCREMEQPFPGTHRRTLKYISDQCYRAAPVLTKR
jgi:hypothetical protein